MSIWMLTVPKSDWRRTWGLIAPYSPKRWVWGLETGKGGYRHVQARVRVADSNDEALEDMIKRFTKAHIEKASDTWEYERKEGLYLTSDDTPEVRAVRFGRQTPTQKAVINLLEEQNDRQILVWWDPEGCHGKSWLCVHLWEQGRACYCPPTLDTAKQIIQHVASAYKGERYIIIDVPRAVKWTTGLYEAIESIKDGLVYDTRYSSTVRDIRGAKILILTNSLPRLDKLSSDRWVFTKDGRDLSS